MKLAALLTALSQAAHKVGGRSTEAMGAMGEAMAVIVIIWWCGQGTRALALGAYYAVLFLCLFGVTLTWIPRLVRRPRVWREMLGFCNPTCTLAYRRSWGRDGQGTPVRPGWRWQPGLV